MTKSTNANRTQPHATTAERNLQQAADTAENSNWATARLIACSVEASKRGPKSFVSRDTKLGINEAAQIMGKSNKTIAAYLAAWNAAAADGHCTPAADLTPEDGWTADMPAADLWETYRNPNSHSAKSETRTIPADPVAAVAQAMPKLTAEQKREIVAEVVKDDPTARPEMTIPEKRAMVRREIESSAIVAAEAREAIAARERTTDADWKAKSAHAKEQAEAFDKSLNGVAYTIASSALDDAARSVGRAKKEAEGVKFTDRQRDLLSEAADDLETRLADFRAAIGAADWDAALASITKEGDK